MFKKNLRDGVVGALALGTAWGLGVLSCVYFEVKLLNECLQATEKEEKPKRVTYQKYYR